MKPIFYKQMMKWTSLLMAVILFATSCNREFDEPTYNGVDPDLKVTHTIKQLQQLRTDAGNKDVVITQDMILAGVVIGDDKSGNLYKQIVIQDASAGINIQLDASNTNANYPAGRKVFVKAKGLTLGAYGGMMQLGLGMNGTSPARIPQSLIGNYLVGGTTNNVVTPVELEIKDVNTSYQNMLVKLKGVQIADADLSKTYADPSQAVSAVNINMVDCSGATLILRNSSFANFAGLAVPKGKGDVTGIYTFFNTTNQFVIRDTSDMSALTGLRCDGSTGGGGGATASSIAELRALYKGADVSLASGTVVGVIVSNGDNETAGNFRIAQEDNSAGIIVYTGTANAALTVGTKVSVNIAGATLKPFNGDLELAYAPGAGAVITASGTGTVTPRVATIAQIAANRTPWSSTLATVNNVTIVEGTSSSTGKNYTLTDASGSLTVFIRTAAGIALTSGTATSITGYVSLFKSSTATDTTTQLGIRTNNDVVGYTAPPPATGISLTTSPLNIDFNGIGTSLPTGVTTRTGATASVLGTIVAPTLTPSTSSTSGTNWASTGGGFKNVASATGLASGATADEQAAAANRALGVRQTGSLEAGAAFVFEINNTTGKNNVKMSFLLQSLDITGTLTNASRRTTWVVDYATGDNPTSFTTAATVTPSALVTTASKFESTTVNVDFGSTLNNISNKVYIRVVTLTATAGDGVAGSGSRATSAIDDVKFTWN
jgi:hypothetical protein